MAIVSFDTLTYAKKLKEAGFTEQQAEVQAEVQAELLQKLSEAQTAHLATKLDITELRTDLERLRTDLERQINELRTDLERRLGAVENRLASIETGFSMMQRLTYIVLGGIGLLFIRSFFQ